VSLFFHKTRLSFILDVLHAESYLFSGTSLLSYAQNFLFSLYLFKLQVTMQISHLGKVLYLLNPHFGKINSICVIIEVILISIS